MTQSKKDENITISIDPTYSVDFDKMVTDDMTTTYWAGDSVTDIVTSPSDGTFTIDIGDYTSDSIDISSIDTSDWIFTNNSIDPNEVERMCKEYPALQKVWRNFKSVYDMVQQDYKGKKEAGEIEDDDIPF